MKRISAWILCVLMLVSLLPLAAWAEGEEAVAEPAAAQEEAALPEVSAASAG